MTGEQKLHVVADIGGSNLRFACARDAGIIPGTAVSVTWSQYPALASALEAFLASQNIDRLDVTRIVVAFAGPAIPVRGKYRFTNVPVAFSRREIVDLLPSAELTVMNDFAAQAYCLLNLHAGDVIPLQPFDGNWPGGNRVIYGPGTGLGVAQLILDGGPPCVVAGEGGNVSFAPPTDEIAALRDGIIAEVVRKRPENPDPTMKPRQEDVLSGSGLENLHHARHGDSLPAEKISELAHGGDAKARETFGLFFDSLAGMGADLALTCLPQGGIFISGGMTRRNLDLLDSDRFRTVFEARWRYRDVLVDIPVFVLKNDTSGLEGAAVAASLT